MSAVALILWGWLAVALLMATTWLFAVLRKNAGVVDIVWTLSLGGLAVFYAIVGPRPLDSKALAIVGIVIVWSLRLGAHIGVRVLSEEEDGRYQSIREIWKTNLNRKLFAFFQLQGFLDALLSLSFLVALIVSPGEWRFTDWIGVLIAASAIAGESLADHQLKAFKANAENKGKVCRKGLWRYSRHPNYFFEWLFWWSFPFFAFGNPYAWLTLLSPLAMYILVTKVTGIPPTEEQSLRSRGEAYREYQKETNAFFPGPSKRNA